MKVERRKIFGFLIVTYLVTSSTPPELDAAHGLDELVLLWVCCVQGDSHNNPFPGQYCTPVSGIQYIPLVLLRLSAYGKYMQSRKPT